MAKKKPEPGFDSLMEKARRFCVYRERGRFETEHKIKSWGIPYNLVEKLMKALEEEKFIDDTRFAAIYARGKFNSNKWGKIKIAAYLREMRISPGDIRDALHGIDMEKYEQTAADLVRKKAATLKETDDFYTRQAKITNYLLQKGYEMNVVKLALQVLK